MTTLKKNCECSTPFGCNSVTLVDNVRKFDFMPRQYNLLSSFISTYTHRPPPSMSRWSTNMCPVRQPPTTRMSLHSAASVLAHHRHAYPSRKTLVVDVPQRYYAGVRMCLCGCFYLQNSITQYTHLRFTYEQFQMSSPGVPFRRFSLAIVQAASGDG